MDCFDTMPISCLVNGKFLAVHGGLSPELKSLSDINDLNRFVEPPRFGMYTDILWSDPVDNEFGHMESNFVPNVARGCSWTWGSEAVNEFL
jgi:serine/threonine-protein phosphatase 2B catalytic subunit